VTDCHRKTLVDIGCGTGLCGQRLSDAYQLITGIDVSAGMLAQAQKKNCYHQLIHADAIQGLETLDEEQDCIIAGDCCPYIGELNALITAVHQRLREGGFFFFFTVETHQDDSLPFKLNRNLRFSHHVAHTQALLNTLGFEVLEMEASVLRQNNEQDVMGQLFAAKKVAHKD